ncbi:MAG: hypothetical protein R6V56_01270 [Lentisphaeria bacterium]
MQNDPKKQRSEKRIAVMLSALAFPGIGQFVQKRLIAGAVYAGLFAVAVGVFAFYATRILIIFYRLGMDFSTYEVPALYLPRMLLSFAAAFAVYVINIIDVVTKSPDKSQSQKNDDE